MATNGDALITELLLRHRNASTDRVSRAFVATILSQCQRVLNLHFGDRITTVSFTPSAERTLYTVAAVAADVAKIVLVRENGRELFSCTFETLTDTDLDWLRRTGPRHEQFARIGGDLWVLYPAKLSPTVVDVVYVTIPDDVADAATPIELSDELVPMLLDMAELVLAMRVRVWSVTTDLLERLKAGFSTPPREGAS